MATATLPPEKINPKPRRATGINSLRYKILVVLMLFSVGPILVLGQTWQIINENETNKQVQLLEKQAFALADTIAGRIQDGAESLIAEAFTAAQLTSAILRLDTVRQDRALPGSPLPLVLNNLLNSRPIIVNVAYAGSDGRVTSAFSKTKLSGMLQQGDNISDQIYFAAPFVKQKVTSAVITPPKSNPYLLLGFPVLSGLQPAGVLIITLDLNAQLEPLIQEKFSTDVELAKVIRSYIVDNKNNLLAKSANIPNPENPGQFVKNNDLVLKAMVSGENQAARLLTITDPATGVKGVQAVLNIKPSILTPTGGERTVELGLIVVVQEPEDTALASVIAFRKQSENQRTLIFVVTVSAAIVALFISVLAALGLVSPIRKLTHGARRIASGDLDTRVQVRSKDEIGELADDFNLMAQKLKSANEVAQTYMNPKAAEMVQRSYAEDNSHSLDGNTEEKTMTLFFSDIVSFTTSTEQLGPAGSIARLNAYYEVVSSLLQEQGGKIDKFVADEIVAMFEDGQDHAYQAVKAAVFTLIALEKWNQRSGFEPVKIRIGINTGECIVANIGSRAARRFDRTVIGDAVNTTQRLMISASHNAIIISEDTYRKVAGRVNVIQLEPLALKGKAQKVTAYQVLGLQETGAKGRMRDESNE